MTPSHGAPGRAHFILAERGDAQPRTLAGGFARAVTGDDLMTASIAALDGFRAVLDAAYGPAGTASCRMELGNGGSLADIVAFARG